jgi:hypothetical protein
VLDFESSNAGLYNCQVLPEMTSDSSAFLNAMFLLKYIVNCEQRFFIFHISIRIICNSLRDGLLYLFAINL